MDLALCADCSGTRSLPDYAIVLTLAVYPFVLVALAIVFRRKGGSLLALTLPASLPPLFLGLTAASLAHARLMQILGVVGLRGRRSTAAALAEGQMTLFLAALIAAICVWLLLMRAAIGRPHVPEPSSRWTRVILPAAALVVLLETQQS